MIISITANSQTNGGSTAVPFLLFNQSPEANAQGCTSVSRITDDAYAINFNPAHLGFSSAQTNAMFSFYPTKTDWLPELGLPDLTFNSYVLSGGINLEKYLSIPLSLGVAYSRVDMNWGTFSRTSDSPEITNTYNAEEYNNAYSVGVGLDIGVRLALGITFRKIDSDLGTASASAWSDDYGFLIDVPMVDLVAKKSEIITGIAPICNLSFGTALTNVGGKISYIDPVQADPLPRTISVGTTVEIGIKYSPTNHELLTFTWSRQSDDLLVGNDTIGNSYYRGGFGNIGFIKNIVEGKQTTQIVNGTSYAVTDLSQGWQIGFCEILYIRGGSFVETGERSFKTKGIGVRASGIFKLFDDLMIPESPALSFIINHFDIRYDQSEYDATDITNPLNNTKFSSLSIIVKL